MKGQTVLSQADRAVLCGAPPPAASGPALKDQLWPEESSGMERLLRKCHIRNQLVRECMAECLGVYVLIAPTMNPAVSLSLCVLGRHPWLKLPFYVFLPGARSPFWLLPTVGLQYYDAIQTYSGGVLTVTGPTATAGIFSTYPADYLSVIGTAALLLCILALGDRRNSPLPDGAQPVLVGAAVLVIGIAMGSNSGYALNPARDFGPRLFTYIAGWGVDVFK
ncbi:hypothetical protein KUCAC02_010983 [Chaenocephalus aceratus]|uniref:Uncharacterized protein n=1 Tax=Chaenocephalus aceratus TaxID=36190 RepID=A0ACB9WW04_CHAAC|nr:hypothetical protein KUCAC02_010983 [Chaenocephalus aceratus]